MTTRWRCKVCQLQDVFQHVPWLKGQALIEEVKVQHQVHSPSCEFWESKVMIQRVKTN